MIDIDEAAKCYQHSTAPDPPIWYQQKRGLAVNATQEEWRPVLGFEGKYEVSNAGSVRSVATGRPLRPWRTPPVGYQTVALRRNGLKYSRRVHVLVLEAFICPRPDGAVACHNDGDHDNNYVDNLRWDTQQSNIRDIVRHGRHQHANKTHCKHGHPFDEVNTYINPASGQRVCRTCVREINRAIRLRKKGAP